jgi:hypothetical protein
VSHHLSTSAIQPAAARQVVVQQAPADNPRPAAPAPAAADPATASTASSVGSAAGPGAVSAAVPAAQAGAVAGTSGVNGANVPVENVATASTQIQGAKHDLSATTQATRRLDGMDGIGGGGGGGGADPNGENDVAAGTANQDVSQDGLGGQVTANSTGDEAVAIGNAKLGGGADVQADPTV